MNVETLGKWAGPQVRWAGLWHFGIEKYRWKFQEEVIFPGVNESFIGNKGIKDGVCWGKRQMKAARMRFDSGLSPPSARDERGVSETPDPDSVPTSASLPTHAQLHNSSGTRDTIRDRGCSGTPHHHEQLQPNIPRLVNPAICLPNASFPLPRQPKALLAKYE